MVYYIVPTSYLVPGSTVLDFSFNIWFFFSELELPEDDRAVGAGTPCEYIESPMSDGTIEEDFEKALAREVADRR